MPDEREVYRPGDLSREASKALEKLKQLEERAADLLSGPSPDSFLNRGTQEPFQLEEDLQFSCREDLLDLA